MLCCLTVSNIIEIVSIVASFILSTILIWVTIGISKKQNKIQKDISERDVKISFMDYRLEFYNELISTVMFLQSELDVLKSRKNNDYYIEYLDKLREKEKRLMQACNTSKFLFNNDEKIENIAKKIYENFSNYRVAYTKIALNLNKIASEYKEHLKTTNTEEEYHRKIKDGRLLNEYLHQAFPQYIDCQQEILDIIKKDEFDEIFKPYFEAEGSLWQEKKQKKKMK